MDWKPILQNRWLLVLGVLGVVLLLFGTMWNRTGSSVSTLASAGTAGKSGGGNTTSTALSTNASSVDPALAFENIYDSQLTSILDQVAGVNSVHVMVTLDSTESLQLAQDIQKTTQSSSSTVNQQPTTVRLANGSTAPVVIQRLAPAVRGVLVTVNARDFYTAKAEIIDAITNVLDVPAYKISIEPQKQNS